jgi:Ca2+-binding RTX toxin-like protein
LYTSGGQSLTFSAIENIYGQSGTDILDFSGSNAVVITLTSAEASGFAGNETTVGISFSGIDEISGSAFVDSLTGLNASSAFEIDGTERYLSGSYALSVSGIENLTGGSGTDLFDIRSAHIGQLDGGSGEDTLDYSNNSSMVDVKLTVLGVFDGFNGTATLLSGGFANINRILGSSLNDRLTGMDMDSNWNITSSTSQYAYSTQTIDFTQFETISGGIANDNFLLNGTVGYTLLGGSGEDIFTFQTGAAFNGILDGQNGNDFIDYHLLSTTVQVNLNSTSVTVSGIIYEPMSASGINGGIGNGFIGIESVTGSQAADLLIGSDGPNTIDGWLGNDTLIGRSGDDIYRFENNWGNDNVIEIPGGGNDTLSFASASVSLAFTAASLQLVLPVPV